nr:MAG TPA: hypothetical protein [Caudoviricetes sp.]
MTHTTHTPDRSKFIILGTCRTATAFQNLFWLKANRA